MSEILTGRGGSTFIDGRFGRPPVGADVPVDRAVCPAADGGPGWIVSGHEETRSFLRDPRFSRAVPAAGVHPRGPATRMSVTELDPPEHTRIRNLVGGAFSARRAEHLRGYVEGCADALLDRLLDRSPATDLLESFCRPLTFAAQSELLGVPESRRRSIRDRATARLGGPGATREEVYRGELHLHQEVVAMLADTDDPPSGLLAGLVTAARADGLLTEDELTGLASSLFFDGHALAAAQIASTVLCVLARPGLWPRLADDPGLTAEVTEEALRYCPSVNLTMTRAATTELTLGGERIAADDLVTAVLPVVNRDGAAFADPRTFRPGRSGVRHLSFGHGTHHCLGAHLARVEIQAALRVLARRTPQLELGAAMSDLTWTVTPTLRSLTALPVRWNAVGRWDRLAEAS